MRKYILIFILVFVASNASADIESEIKSDCTDREVSVISISDPSSTGSHPAEPDYYDSNLCISGIEDSSITEDQCGSTEGFYLTDREDNAHFSVFGSYRLKVCTGDMKVRVTGSGQNCMDNETALFSVSSEDNAHVSGIGVFDRLACGGYAAPSNVSLSLKFNHTSSDEVYFDGDSVNGEQSFVSADFPYMISEGNIMVSGIVKEEFKSASREINGENVLTITSSRGSASFIIPYTEGGEEDIRNREELIEQDAFLNEIRPSFGYLLSDSPTVRVIYNPELELESSISFSPGSFQFDVVKTGDNRIGLLTPDERSGN